MNQHKTLWSETNVCLSFMGLFCLSLTGFRCYWYGNMSYMFLVWNLFLAAVPLGLSWLLTQRFPSQSKTFSPIHWAILCFWLLFFPNAPYILTDLFHLTPRGNVPFWFDLALLLSYALTGLMFGLVSLLDVDRWLRERLPQFLVSFLMVGILFLSGFGVYLGRFQRWNSWDLISNPFALMVDIADRFIHPFSHHRTWAVTVLIGVILNFMFWCIRSLQARPEPERV